MTIGSVPAREMNGYRRALSASIRACCAWTGGSCQDSPRASAPLTTPRTVRRSRRGNELRSTVPPAFSCRQRSNERTAGLVTTGMVQNYLLNPAAAYLGRQRRETLMARTRVEPLDADAVRQLVTETESLVTAAVEVARRRTEGGKGIDAAQAHCERLAYAVTELAAARAFLAYTQAAATQGRRDPIVDDMAALFAAEVAHRLGSQIDAHADEFGLPDDLLNSTLGDAPIKATMRRALSDARVQAIGCEVMQQRGVNHCWIAEDMAIMSRDSVRQFAETEVMPIAERLHRHDELIPEALIGKMAALGYFGMSVP